MNHPYRVFIANEVITALRTLPKAHQVQITKLFDELEVNPFRRGDYVETDELGRPIQVVVLARYAAFFWADHAVREVKITDLRAAGH